MPSTLTECDLHVHLGFEILCQYSFEVISTQGAWRFRSTALLSFLLLLKCLWFVANCHISLRSKWCTQILFIELSFCTDVPEDFSELVKWQALRQLHVPVVRKLSALCGSRRVVLNAEALAGLVGCLQPLQKIKGSLCWGCVLPDYSRRGEERSGISLKHIAEPVVTRLVSAARF